MTHRIKTIAATIAAFTFTGTAIAQEDITTVFSIDPSASVEINYETIRETANQACRSMHPRSTTASTLSLRRVKKKCRLELIAAAVSAFDDPYISAYHENRRVGFLVFASND